LTMDQRKIYLSVRLASQAIKDKDMLEALAVNILIKRYEVSSVFKNATVRRLKDVLHVGTERAKRIIDREVGFQRSGATIFNLLEKDKNNNILALRIRATNRYKHNFILIFEADKTYSVSNVMDMVRSCVLANKIKSQAYIADTVQKAENPRNMREFRLAKKRLKRLEAKQSYTNNGIKRNYTGENNGFSYSAVMKATNTKRYKAKKLIRGLVIRGVVLSKEVIKPTLIQAEEYSRNFAHYFNECGVSGRLFVKDGNVMLQLANVYDYVGDIID